MRKRFLVVVGSLILLVSSVSVFAQDQTIVDSIECDGNTLTECSVIRDRILLQPGDPLNEEEIQNAKVRLGLLGLFSRVDIRLKKGNERNHVLVVVSVEEASPLYSFLGTGPRVDSGNWAQFTDLQFGHRNLFGRGKTLQMKLHYGRNLNGDFLDQALGYLEYIDPHAFGSKKIFSSLGAGVLNTMKARPAYTQEAQHLSVLGTIGARFGNFSYVSISLRGLLHRKYLYRNTVLSSNESTDPPPGLGFITYGWNSEDDVFFPRRGSSFEVGVGHSFGGGAESPAPYLALAYRRHWLLDPVIFTLSLGVRRSPHENGEHFTAPEIAESPISLRASYEFRRNRFESFVRTGRLFVEPGLNTTNFNYRRSGDVTPTLKVGTTLDTGSLGTIQIFGFYGPGAL